MNNKSKNALITFIVVIVLLAIGFCGCTSYKGCQETRWYKTKAYYTAPFKGRR